MDTTYDSDLFEDVAIFRRAGLVAPPREVTSRWPRLCCRCAGILWPFRSHLSAVVRHPETGELSDRRMHLHACERREADPFPAYTPADRFVTALDRWVGWVGVAFAIAVVCALWFALGYQW